MYAIELLVSEHENISHLTNMMHGICLRILEGEKVNTKVFRQCIAIIRGYADKHHHGKEESLLFQEMQVRLGSTAENLVKNGMLVEHDLGRLYVKQLESAVADFEENESTESKLNILVNAMAYADLLKRHIERENSVVYPYAERSLSKEVLESLNVKTREFEKNNEEERIQHLDVLAFLLSHQENVDSNTNTDKK